MRGQKRDAEGPYNVACSTDTQALYFNNIPVNNRTPLLMTRILCPWGGWVGGGEGGGEMYVNYLGGIFCCPGGVQVYIQIMSWGWGGSGLGYTVLGAGGNGVTVLGDVA